jgi:hypothetical protein
MYPYFLRPLTILELLLRYPQKAKSVNDQMFHAPRLLFLEPERQKENLDELIAEGIVELQDPILDPALHLGEETLLYTERVSNNGHPNWNSGFALPERSRFGWQANANVGGYIALNNDKPLKGLLYRTIAQAFQVINRSFLEQEMRISSRRGKSPFVLTKSEHLYSKRMLENFAYNQLLGAYKTGAPVPYTPLSRYCGLRANEQAGAWYMHKGPNRTRLDKESGFTNSSLFLPLCVGVMAHYFRQARALTEQKAQ